MVIYRVETPHNSDESSGYVYFSNKQKAEEYLSQLRKEHGEWWKWDNEPIEKIEFENNKSGIISMMTQFASHPDNA